MARSKGVSCSARLHDFQPGLGCSLLSDWKLCLSSSGVASLPTGDQGAKYFRLIEYIIILGEESFEIFLD